MIQDFADDRGEGCPALKGKPRPNLGKRARTKATKEGAAFFEKSEKISE
jgi:hypothetical protein